MREVLQHRRPSVRMPSGAYAFGGFSMTQRRAILPSMISATSVPVTATGPSFGAGVPWQDAKAVMSDGDGLGHEGEGWPELLQELAGDLGDRRTSADHVGRLIHDRLGNEKLVNGYSTLAGVPLVEHSFEVGAKQAIVIRLARFRRCRRGVWHGSPFQLSLAFD